jgi:hypothetical protein
MRPLPGSPGVVGGRAKRIRGALGGRSTPGTGQRSPIPAGTGGLSAAFCRVSRRPLPSRWFRHGSLLPRAESPAPTYYGHRSQAGIRPHSGRVAQQALTASWYHCPSVSRSASG